MKEINVHICKSTTITIYNMFITFLPIKSDVYQLQNRIYRKTTEKYTNYLNI